MAWEDDTEPGDLDGPPMKWSTRVAKGCRAETMEGWEFARTWAFVGDPFDPDKPPAGDGWVKNEYVAAGGSEMRDTASGQQQHVVYWRRRKAIGP